MKKTFLFGLVLLALMMGLNFSPFFCSALTKASPKAAGGPRVQVDQPKAGQAVFYVSPLGNDQWSGKLDHPNPQHSDGSFRSLVRARDAVRQLKASGLLKSRVIVYLRGGVYQLDQTLVFTPQDSGTAKAPII